MKGALAVWNEWLACMGIGGAVVGEVTGFSYAVVKLQTSTN